MHQYDPNGFFGDDLIIYGGLNRGCQVSRGFKITTEDLRNSSVDTRLLTRHSLQAVLATLSEGTNAQLVWGVDSDYRSALQRYDGETDDYVVRERDAGREPQTWVERNRRERVVRYSEAMKHRKLRREQLHLFITQEIKTNPPIISTRKHLFKNYSKTFSQIKNDLREGQQLYQAILGSSTQVIAMNDYDHYEYYKRFLNPSLADHYDTDLRDGFQIEDYTIQELCWNCSYVPMPTRPEGFYMDGYYHTIFVLKRWPKSTEPCMMQRLTSLPFLDYRITVNIRPKSIKDQVIKSEDQLTRNRGDFIATGAHRLLTSARKMEAQIERLSAGYTFPFDAQVSIHVWAKSLEELDAKNNAIKNQISRMSGAQQQEISLGTEAKKIFYSTWPGFQSTYTPFYYYAESDFLADLLPYSSTFTGFLGEAEALYDGSNGNLVGFSTYRGGTPQHTTLVGMRGAGKSVNVCDLLTQTSIYYPYTVIIEEGLSYGLFTRTFQYKDHNNVIQNCRPLIIHPDADLCLNLFDTQKAPLNQGHLSILTALISRMVGESSDLEKQSLNEAIFTHYITQLYQDHFESWSRRNPEKMHEAARLAYATESYKRDRMAIGTTSLESYAAIRDLKNAGDDEILSYISAIPEGEITKFTKENDTARRVMQMAFSYFGPEEYPQLSHLQETMRHSTYSKHDKSRVQDLATLLTQWTQDGSYKLFDGVSNASLTGPISHFELGYIPEDAKSLKAAAGLLISGFVRQHIITLPRATRKRMIFEEVGRTLDMPGGEKIVSEAYAQLRKFNTWVISIVQQYDRFKHSRVRATVIGNSTQHIVMRQQDRTDLEDFSKAISIPDTAQNAIMEFPLPENQPKTQRFTSFSYHVPSLTPSMTGTVRNIVSPEMLYCSSSSGEIFEKREAALKKYSSVTEGIIEEAKTNTLG